MVVVADSLRSAQVLVQIPSECCFLLKVRLRVGLRSVHQFLPQNVKNCIALPR
jgi:hypothetical protein